MSTSGGYHEYIGEYHEYMGGGIMSTSGGGGGYHEYIRCSMSTWGIS